MFEQSPAALAIPVAYTGMHARAAEWIVVIAWVALGLAFACAAAIALDVFARGYRQKMPIMNAVWPITALYFGPVALYFYLRRGRRKSPKWQEEHPGQEEELGRTVGGAPWWSVSKADAHCGAGCTLGDIIGEWSVWLIGLTIPIFGYYAANEFVAMILVDFVLAWSFGILFQYHTIVPMRGLGLREGLRTAIKADTASIVAFQAGLFTYMGLYHLLFWKPPLSLPTPEYWFMMQVGMVVGFLTAWPVNVWLLRTGIKEKM